MKHIIRIPEDFAPYDPITKIQWVLVDEKDRVPLVVSSEDLINQAIVDLAAQLEEQDRQKEEEEKHSVKHYSTFALYVALTKLGLWDQLESWLKEQSIDGVNAWKAFTLVQELASDHPMFVEYLAQIKDILGLTDEEVNRILKSCEIEG